MDDLDNTLSFSVVPSSLEQLVTTEDKTMIVKMNFFHGILLLLLKFIFFYYFMGINFTSVFTIGFELRSFGIFHLYRRHNHQKTRNNLMYLRFNS